MSLLKKAFFQGSWFAFFNFLSQLFSWCVTIVVARLLSPDAYGLMAVAYILVGYIERFRELGFGAAIIQKPKISNNDLSSIFWFALIYSFLLYLICFFASYPTAVFFQKEKIAPLMQVVSATFITSGLQIVPSSLLRKQLAFKKMGVLKLVSTIVSSITVLVAAILGGGVWALVYGHIARSLTSLLLIFPMSGWKPVFVANFKETVSYLKFGLIVTMNRTLFYVNENSDTFFAGRVWNATTLGYYSFALQLSRMPMDKIVSVIQQVFFPLIASLQSDKDKIRDVYVKTIKLISIIVFPIYVGGYLLGEELILLLLGEKWTAITSIFKYLCLSQIITPLSAMNNPIHTAMGRPQLSLVYYIISTILMSISFYFAVQFGLNAIIIPWVTVYLFINIVWILVTINKIGVAFYTIFDLLLKPVAATFIMILFILFFDYCIIVSTLEIGLASVVCIKIAIGATAYLSVLWLIDRESFVNFKEFVRT